MDHLNQREQAFLETVKAWTDQPNTELYLAGTVRGRIDLEEDIERFTIRDDASMSQPLVEALKEMGAKDLRVGPETTLNLMTQMTRESLKLAVQEAANEHLEQSERSDSPAPTH